VCSAANSSLCTTCAAGFYYNASTLQCNPQQCPAGFILSAGSCICAPMTMLSGSACVTCPSSCATCSGLGCLTCLNGYYPSYNYSCVACVANCAICSTSICSQCLKGFSLQTDGSCESVGGGVSCTNVNGNIVPCDPGCSTCVAGTSNNVICISAQEGYSIVGGVAIQCTN
jgi:hypothetical protein